MLSLSYIIDAMIIDTVVVIAIVVVDILIIVILIIITDFFYIILAWLEDDLHRRRLDWTYGHDYKRSSMYNIR